MKKSYIVVLSLIVTMPAIPDALAASSATNNQCWGDISQQMGELGAMGVHTRAGATFTSQPRQGAANANTTEDGEPGDGGLGNHAIRVGGLIEVVASNPEIAVRDKDGQILTEALVCDGTPGNPGPSIP
jgi:hypothetical protein